MVDKKPNEILRTPKFGFLYYGDGYSAEIRESRPSKDQEGKDCIEFELDPTEPLKKDYNLKPIPPRTDYVYKVKLPYEFVKQLNYSPHYTRWLYLKTYDGVITPQMSELMPIKLLQEIQDLKTTIRNMQRQLDVANENSELLKTDLPKYLKKNVFGIAEQAMPILEKLNPKKPEDK